MGFYVDCHLILDLFNPYSGLSRAYFGLFAYKKQLFTKIGSHSWQYNHCNAIGMNMRFMFRA